MVFLYRMGLSAYALWEKYQQVAEEFFKLVKQTEGNAPQLDWTLESQQKRHNIEVAQGADKGENNTVNKVAEEESNAERKGGDLTAEDLASKLNDLRLVEDMKR